MRAASQADAQFAELSKRWLEGWLPLNPVAATQIGDHRFDGRLPDLSASGVTAQLRAIDDHITALDAVDDVELDDGLHFGMQSCF